MKDKRGQGLSVNAIIMIVLGVVVLVVLIIGFTIGWAKLLPFLSTNNVENIKTSCSVACTTGSTYDFCTQSRTLKADDLPTGEEEVVGNCSFFTTGNYTKYGIGACPSTPCP